MFEISMLPADEGDCLWIEYGSERKPYRIVVDCGTKRTAEHLIAKTRALPSAQRRFDLIVLTHIDSDHVGGASGFLQYLSDEQVPVDDVWFNSYYHLTSTDLLGVRDAEAAGSILEKARLSWNRKQSGAPLVIDLEREENSELNPDPGNSLESWTIAGGMKLTLLSPTPHELRRLRPKWKSALNKHGLDTAIPNGGTLRSHPDARDTLEFLGGKRPPKAIAPERLNIEALARSLFVSDRSLPNGSSIALLAELEENAVLLAGDAYARVLIPSIKRLLSERHASRLALSAFKLPHHGSAGNLSRELLDLIDCQAFLVSTNGRKFYHPDREAIARLITHRPEPLQLFFNYRAESTAFWDSRTLKKKYNYETVFPDDGEPLTIQLHSV